MRRGDRGSARRRAWSASRAASRRVAEVFRAARATGSSRRPRRRYLPRPRPPRRAPSSSPPRAAPSSASSPPSGRSAWSTCAASRSSSTPRCGTLRRARRRDITVVRGYREGGGRRAGRSPRRQRRLRDDRRARVARVREVDRCDGPCIVTLRRHALPPATSSTSCSTPRATSSSPSTRLQRGKADADARARPTGSRAPGAALAQDAPRGRALEGHPAHRTTISRRHRTASGSASSSSRPAARRRSSPSSSGDAGRDGARAGEPPRSAPRLDRRRPAEVKVVYTRGGLARRRRRLATSPRARNVHVIAAEVLLRPGAAPGLLALRGRALLVRDAVHQLRHRRSAGPRRTSARRARARRSPSRRAPELGRPARRGHDAELGARQRGQPAHLAELRRSASRPCWWSRWRGEPADRTTSRSTS